MSFNYSYIRRHFQ